MIDFNYKIRAASQEEIMHHLKECNNNFIPPLDQTVNLPAYSKKIFENAITFEAWENTSLAGLVAAYFNDPENVTGFITNVSVVKVYSGKRVAFNLMNTCINYAIQNKFQKIILEVSKENNAAILLYEKLNFIPFENKDNFVKMILHI